MMLGSISDAAERIQGLYRPIEMQEDFKHIGQIMQINESHCLLVEILFMLRNQ